jgi:hypothetical protein
MTNSPSSHRSPFLSIGRKTSFLCDFLTSFLISRLKFSLTSLFRLSVWAKKDRSLYSFWILRVDFPFLQHLFVLLSPLTEWPRNLLLRNLLAYFEKFLGLRFSSFPHGLQQGEEAEGGKREFPLDRRGCRGSGMDLFSRPSRASHSSPKKKNKKTAAMLFFHLHLPSTLLYECPTRRSPTPLPQTHTDCFHTCVPLISTTTTDCFLTPPSRGGMGSPLAFLLFC